ncbi:unnamed protein product [Ectocarpus sp. 12 AP-2014]
MEYIFNRFPLVSPSAHTHTPLPPRAPCYRRAEDAGALYTIGSGGTYCLGNGTGGKSQTRNQPERVKPLSRVEVAHITCGASHTAALIRPRPREG